MKWKYQDDVRGCGQVETEEHVLFEYNRNGQERTIERLKDRMCEYEIIKGYHVENDEIEEEAMRYVRVLWNSRQRYERMRDC